LLLLAAAQMGTQQSRSFARVAEIHDSVLTALTHRADSAVVPLAQQARSSRAALGKLLSVPLADLLACVALLASWFVASVRRRTRMSCAVLTYRHRGPPALPLVS
jgi:hypothetical protein